MSAFLTWQEISEGKGAFFYKEILTAVASDGNKIKVVRKWKPESRKKAAVILVHGFAQNRYTWHLKGRSFVNYLAFHDYDVFNVDLRGHGRSSTVSSPPSRFEDYVEKDMPAVVDLVSSVSGHNKVFLIGHSLGGAVIYASAPLFPEKIRGIVTIGGVFLFGQGQKIFNFISKLLTSLDKSLSFFDFLKVIPFYLVGRVLEPLTVFLNSPLLKEFPVTPWFPGSIEEELAGLRLVEGFDRTGMEVLKLMIRWASTGKFTDTEGRKDYFREFIELDVPLLVITGDKDTLCTHLDAYPAYYFSRSSDKEYKIFTYRDGKTHWGHIDLITGKKAPEYVWPYIRRWLDQR